jgi:hypothetical protein
VGGDVTGACHGEVDLQLEWLEPGRSAAALARLVLSCSCTPLCCSMSGSSFCHAWSIWRSAGDGAACAWVAEVTVTSTTVSRARMACRGLVRAARSTTNQIRRCTPRAFAVHDDDYCAS